MIKASLIEDLVTAFSEALGSGEPEYILPASTGGAVLSEPLDGIVCYTLPDQLVYITLGYSELYEKESPNPGVSGYGFEMVFRLDRTLHERSILDWVAAFLQKLAVHVFNTGKVFQAGDAIHFKSPITEDTSTSVTGCYFVYDPELPSITNKNGTVMFLLAVGITTAEWELYQEKGAEMLEKHLDLHSAKCITNVARKSE